MMLGYVLGMWYYKTKAVWQLTFLKDRKRLGKKEGK